MGRGAAQPVPVEKRLRTVRVTMIAQAVLGMAGGVLVLYLLGLSEDGGDTTGYGALRALTVLSTALSGLLLVCAVRLLRRLPWVRVTTLVIEGITVVSGLVGLVSAVSGGQVGPMTVVPIALGAAVIVPLLSRDVSEWFAGHGGAVADRRSTEGGSGVPVR